MKDRTVIMPPPVPPASSSGNITLFLGLILLVLAFFILLVSISTLEDVKSKAVKDSLTSTFTTVLPPSTDPTEFSTREGNILAGSLFQEQVTGIFSTALQLAKVEIVQPGEVMRLQVPARQLFTEGQTALREDAVPLFDRMVAALSSAPPGLRFDMEFVAGSEREAGGALPVNQTLEIARAGAFVRQMAERGAPPGSIAVGLAPGEPQRITMWFFVRPEEELLSRFQNYRSGGYE